MRWLISFALVSSCSPAAAPPSVSVAPAPSVAATDQGLPGQYRGTVTYRWHRGRETITKGTFSSTLTVFVPEKDLALLDLLDEGSTVCSISADGPDLRNMTVSSGKECNSNKLAGFIKIDQGRVDFGSTSLSKDRFCECGDRLHTTLALRHHNLSGGLEETELEFDGTCECSGKKPLSSGGFHGTYAGDLAWDYRGDSKTSGSVPTRIGVSFVTAGDVNIDVFRGDKRICGLSAHGNDWRHMSTSVSVPCMELVGPGHVMLMGGFLDFPEQPPGGAACKKGDLVNLTLLGQYELVRVKDRGKVEAHFQGRCE